MITLNKISELRAQLAVWRGQGERIALVPSMGNLHAGHISLVDIARQQAERCVATIFVNPTQFGPGEDYDSYPRTLEADAEKLQAAGVDLLFAPPVAEVYPWMAAQNRAESAENAPYLATTVSVPQITDFLCGASRPGHFDGVSTVVSILFNWVQPDVAIFGKKDYQQLAVIRKMVADMHVPVEVIGADICREADGLAMSSRNQYLTASERKIAPELQQTLQGMARSLAGGHRDSVSLQRLCDDASAQLNAAGFRVDYLEIRKPTLQLPDNPDYGKLVLLAAAWLGQARLLDNLEVAATMRGAGEETV